MLTALALVFVGAGAGYLIGQRVRVVPPPVAALLLGTLLGAGGPFGANLLWSEPQPLPPEPLATFRVLGAILLMWGAGVEMEVSLLRRRRHLFDAAAIGLSGALLSALATLGLLGSGLLGQFPAREQFGLVLLSAASAIPVLLAIVQSLGKTHHPLTATALTAALMVDLLLIALLPLATAEATPERALLPFARTLAYLLAMLLLAQGPWNGFVRQLGRRFWASSSRASPILVIGLGLIVGVTAAVELWGVDPLPAALGWGIGSKPFFFPDSGERENPFRDAFFVFEAAYFVVAGAMVDLRLISAAGVLFGVAAATAKVVGGAVRAADGLRVGALLVPRGAVDLVLAVGLLSAGVLSPAGYALAVTMIVTTTVAGAAGAQLVFAQSPPAEG